MRRVMSWVVLVLGAVLLALAVLAGFLNRTVLDAPTFAEGVDELRQRDDVSAVLGQEISQQLIANNPDLVAIAPLVEQIATGVVSSDLLSGPVRLAASQFHQAMLSGDSDQLVLRVADAGAVVAGVLGAAAPERAPNASEAAATLADIGGQELTADLIELVDLVDTLAWLLPLLALACFVGAVLLHDGGWNGVRRVGWAVLLAAGGLAGLLVVAAAAVRAAGGTDAMIDGVWDVFVRPIWWPIALVAVVGALGIMVGSGRAASWSATGVTRRLRMQPTTIVGAAARGLALVGVGLAAIVDPHGVLVAAAFVGGVLAVVAGIGSLAGLAPRRAAKPSDAPDGEHAGHRTLVITAVLGVVMLVGLAIWAARSPADEVAGANGGAVAGTGEVCNGHAELCDRRFDEVSYAASHNSMSVAGKPGWFLGEQGLDIVPQLDFGVRALLVDVWYGRDAGNGKVRTSARSYEEALAVANEELGPEIVDAALRVIDAVAPGEPQGPEALYLCHGLCETGATSFDATLTDIRSWLATHPDEVLSIFVEDHVDAADIGAAVERAGLADYAFTPAAGDPFPTLGEMVRSGRRLLVMLEEGDGRPERPWLINGFDVVQETPYTFPTVDDFSCAPNRGDPDAPLLQINHWLSGFTELVTSAQQVNTTEVLGARARQCQQERSLQPTFVAVNYADIGDLVAVVDELNDIG